MNAVFKETIQFFKANIFAISLLTLKIEFPFIIIGNLDILGKFPSIINAWTALVSVVFMFVVIPFSTGAQASLYSQIINESELNLSDCISVSKSHIIFLIIASFCFFITFFGGLLLFIIPGIIIGARLSFFPFFIVYEGYKPLPALRESFYVTRNYVWKIAIPIIFLNIIITTPVMIISLIFQDTGFLNFIVWIILDSVYAIVGWLSLIVVFRFYCIYRKEMSLN